MLTDQQEFIHIGSVRTRDEIWKTCSKQWMIGTDGKKESVREIRTSSAYFTIKSATQSSFLCLTTFFSSNCCISGSEVITILVNKNINFLLFNTKCRNCCVCVCVQERE